jgi:hypothetical protein
VGWLDVAVTVLLLGFGVVVAAVLLIEGGSVLEAAVALLLFGSVTWRWSQTSFTRETIGDWRRRRAARRR